MKTGLSIPRERSKILFAVNGSEQLCVEFKRALQSKLDVEVLTTSNSSDAVEIIRCEREKLVGVVTYLQIPQTINGHQIADAALEAEKPLIMIAVHPNLIRADIRLRCSGIVPGTKAQELFEKLTIEIQKVIERTLLHASRE